MLTGEKRKKIAAFAAVLTLSAVIFGGCRDGNHNDVTATTATTVEANATAVSTEPTDAVDTTAKKNIISNQPAAETTEPAPTDLDLLYPDDVAEIRQRMDVTGDILGVAFVCYVDSDAELPIVQDKIRYSFFESEYTVTNRMTDKQFILDTDGAEIYAVIPKNKNCTVKVCRALINDDGTYSDKTDAPFFTTTTGEPFILRCNISEIYSDVLITVSEKGGAEFKYRPMLSMMDGRLAQTDRIYDFSIYSEGPFDGYSIATAYDLLLQEEEIKYYTQEKNMSLLYTNEIQEINGVPFMIFALGTNTDDQFVREKLYAISDNLIYTYDVLNDSWHTLGNG